VTPCGACMGFVGVTTGNSSIMRVFPRWAEVLGLPTRRLVGHDVGVDAPAETYRRVIADIRDDPQHLGALITTHKMAVFRHALDLFDEVDGLARTFGEISSVAKRAGRLIGSAKDPVTVRLALEDFLPPDHFTRTGAAALVLGSGGAGCALTYALGLRSDAPSLIICTALDSTPLDHQRALHERAGIRADRLRYVVTPTPDDATVLLSQLPAGSLIVNATGMGKDRAGSPLTPSVAFPEGGYVWDFNYRGSLDFLAQARSQQANRSLVVEDGWRYFIHGWTEGIADVFDIEIPAAMIPRLSAVAAEVR
jgi:shikimate dehydrogenase